MNVEHKEAQVGGVDNHSGVDSACSTFAPAPTPTPTPTQTATIPPTATPSPTPTATAVPSIAPSLTPTPTFLPTLPSVKVPGTVLNLYATNGGCMLPCWWGIVPGETPWESARGFLEPFALAINKFISDSGQLFYYSHFQVPAEINSSENINIAFRINNANIVDFIETANPWRIDNPEYSLSYLLSTYGIPSEIRLAARANIPHTGKPFYTYYLFYSNLGILTASSNEANLLEDSIEICPQYFSETPILWLWDKDLGFTFDFLNENGFIINTHLPNIFLKIEDVSNFDVDRFYETYLAPNSTECIETPLSIWE